MANDIPLTITGWAASDPASSNKGNAFTRFRMGSTSRFFDKENKAWTDGRTEWFTVNIFRETLARNAAASIRRGDPLIVSGSLRTTEWQKDSGEKMMSMELVADSVGHNLAFGSSHFSRNVTSPEDEQTERKGERSGDTAWESDGETASADVHDAEPEAAVPVH